VWHVGARTLPLVVGALALLGAIVGYQGHPTVPVLVVFLTFWTPLPALIGWFAVLASRELTSAHGKALLTATYVPSALAVAGLALSALRGPPPPEGASHMAPFLWPPLLCVLGLCLYVLLRAVSALSERGRAG
jgi:hypothetical protein